MLLALLALGFSQLIKVAISLLVFQYAFLSLLALPYGAQTSEYKILLGTRRKALIRRTIKLIYHLRVQVRELASD